MPSVPSEPEKYSIDEMMDRLKAGSEGRPEDGELVTRADGSQAIRVRKRKRRSNQPHKEEQKRTRRARIVQVSAALVLVFVALLAVGGAVIFANSSPFREALVKKIATATGATVELEQFRMNPRAAIAGGMLLEWPAGNVLESLRLRGLEAEIFPSSFTGKAMKGEEIRVAEANLALRVPQAGAPLRAVPAVAGEKPVIFNLYRTPRLNVVLGGADAPVLRVDGTEGSLSTTSVAGRPQMRLYRGDLAIAGWPALRLDRGLVEFHGSEVDIISLRMLAEHTDAGSMEFSGTVVPLDPARITALDVRLDRFELAGLTGPGLGAIFAGKIDSTGPDGSNVLTFRPTAEPDARMEIAFRSSPTSLLEMKGMPFLGVLSQTLQDEWFDRPVFESDATGMLRRRDGAVALTDLKLAAKARMALRGNIAMAADRTLSGTLAVGLTEAMITTSGSAKLDAAFGPLEDGFRWLRITVSGTDSAPADNFRELVAAAQPAQDPDGADVAPSGSTFEELTRPR